MHGFNGLYGQCTWAPSALSWFLNPLPCASWRIEPSSASLGRSLILSGLLRSFLCLAPSCGRCPCFSPSSWSQPSWKRPQVGQRVHFKSREGAVWGVVARKPSETETIVQVASRPGATRQHRYSKGAQGRSSSTSQQEFQVMDSEMLWNLRGFWVLPVYRSLLLFSILRCCVADKWWRLPLFLRT